MRCWFLLVFFLNLPLKAGSFHNQNEVIRQWSSQLLAQKLVGPETDAAVWMWMSCALMDILLKKKLGPFSDGEWAELDHLLNGSKDLKAIHQSLVRLGTTQDFVLSDLMSPTLIQRIPSNRDKQYQEIMRPAMKGVAKCTIDVEQGIAQHMALVKEREKFWMKAALYTCGLCLPCTIFYCLRNECFCSMSDDSKAYHQLIEVGRELRAFLQTWNSDYFHEGELNLIESYINKATVLPIALIRLIYTFLPHEPVLDVSKRLIATDSSEPKAPDVQ